MSKKEVEVILGFDETGNGFHIQPKNPFHSEPHLTITGYLYPNIGRAAYGTPPNEGKSGAFNKKADFSQTLKKARNYFKNNPDFLYTTIPKSLDDKFKEILRAQAIAMLTFGFFAKYPLFPKSTEIIIDGIDKRHNQIYEMDKNGTSSFINQILDYFLSHSLLQVPHISKTYADKRVIAVQKADRAGYYITALNLLGKNSGWAYKTNRIAFEISNLERLAVQAQESIHERQKTF